MILPEATLFPHASMPLFIFEPRYRAMLAWAIEQHRMFCIALMKPGVEEAKSGDDFHHVAGLGLVRACVQHPDGTSHLVLQGLARVRLTDFIQEKPFRIAELREIESRPASADEGEKLSAQVLEICARYRDTALKSPTNSTGNWSRRPIRRCSATSLRIHSCAMRIGGSTSSKSATSRSGCAL